MQNLVAAPAIVAEERREGQQPGSYPHQVCIEYHSKPIYSLEKSGSIKIRMSHQQVRQGEDTARSSGPLQMNGVGGGSGSGWMEWVVGEGDDCV